MKEEQQPSNPLPKEEVDFLHADMDEIVFMHRHKAYGAYQLRKQYARNLVKGMVIAVSLLLLILNFQTIVNAIRGIDLRNQEKITEVELTDVRYVEAERHLPQAPIVEQAAPKQHRENTVKPIEKVEKPKTEVPVVKKEESKNEAVDDKTTEGSPDSPVDGQSTDATPETEQADTPTPAKPVSTGEPQKVLLEEVPSYSGGEKEMLRFIYANIRYPEAARDAGVQGTAYITFIIEKDGSVTNVVIKQDLPSGCGNEAARVVRLMPRWVPGKLHGRPIRAQFTLPIEFKLLDE